MVRLIVSFFLVRHVYLEHVLGIGFFMPRNLIVASPIAFEPSMAPSITMKNAVVPPLIVACQKPIGHVSVPSRPHGLLLLQSLRRRLMRHARFSARSAAVSAKCSVLVDCCGLLCAVCAGSSAMDAGWCTLACTKYQMSA